MYCSNCGFQFNGNFCPRCGTKSQKILPHNSASGGTPENTQPFGKDPQNTQPSGGTDHVQGGTFHTQSADVFAKAGRSAPGKRNSRPNRFLIIMLVIILLGFSCGKITGSGSRSSSASGKQESTKAAEKDRSKEEKTTEAGKAAEAGTDAPRSSINSTPPEGYVYITPQDLQKYCANLTGQKIYTVITISDMKDGCIQSTLADGYMMSTFNTLKDYKDQFQADDVVAIYGTVNSFQHYFTGTSVTLIGCDVFASDEYASEYIQEHTDDSLSGALVMTPEVAGTLDDSQISEEEYISICKPADHKDILRNPDSYKNSYITVKGKVAQVIDGILNTVTIYITDGNGDKWEISYLYPEGESRILEGDRLTVYGKCKGTSHSTTLAGKQITLPYIDMKYYK